MDRQEKLDRQETWSLIYIPAHQDRKVIPWRHSAGATTDFWVHHDMLSCFFVILLLISSSFSSRKSESNWATSQFVKNT